MSGRIQASPTEIAAIHQQLLLQKQQQQQSSDSPQSSPKSKQKSKLKSNEQKQHQDNTKGLPFVDQFANIDGVNSGGDEKKFAASSSGKQPAAAVTGALLQQASHQAKGLAHKIVRSYESLPKRSGRYFGTFCIVVILVCLFALISISKNDNTARSGKSVDDLSKSFESLDSMSQLALTSAKLSNDKAFSGTDAPSKGHLHQSNHVMHTGDKLSDEDKIKIKSKIKEDQIERETSPSQVARANSRKLPSDPATSTTITNKLGGNSHFVRGPISSLFEELLEAASTHGKPSRDEVDLSSSSSAFDVAMGPRQATIIISSSNNNNESPFDFPLGPPSSMSTARFGPDNLIDSLPLMMFDRIMRLSNAAAAAHHHQAHRPSQDSDYPHSPRPSVTPVETRSNVRWMSPSESRSPLSPPLPHMLGMFPPFSFVSPMSSSLSMSVSPTFSSPHHAHRPNLMDIWASSDSSTRDTSTSLANNNDTNESHLPPWLNLLPFRRPSPSITTGSMSNVAESPLMTAILSRKRDTQSHQPQQQQSVTNATSSLPPHLENFTSVTSIAALPERRMSSYATATQSKAPMFMSRLFPRDERKSIMFRRITDKDDFQSGDDDTTDRAAVESNNDDDQDFPFGFAIASAPARIHVPAGESNMARGPTFRPHTHEFLLLRQEVPNEHRERESEQDFESSSNDKPHNHFFRHLMSKEAIEPRKDSLGEERNVPTSRSLFGLPRFGPHRE